MRWIFIASSIALTALSVGYVVNALDYETIRNLIGPRLLFVCVATAPLYATVLFLRGARIAMASRFLSDATLSVIEGGQVATLHSLANHVLPFRIGESAFVVLTRFVFHVPIASATGLLLVLRLYDVVALSCLGAVGLLALEGSLLPIAGATFALVLAARLDVFVLLPVATLADSLGERARRLASRLRDGARYVRNPRFVTMALGFSTAIWTAQAAFFGSVWWALGETVQPLQLLVPTAITNLAGFIPASALGTFGPLEAGWTVGFGWVGLDRELAAATGILMHLVVVITLAIGSGVFVLRLGPRLWQGIAEWRSGEPRG